MTIGMILWAFLNLAALATSAVGLLQPSTCLIPTETTPSFFWTKATPHFYDHSLNECLLEYKPNPTLEKINVMVFGDSFDLASKFHALILEPTLKPKYFSQGMPDDPVQVYFTRLYGVEGTLRNVSWAPSRLTLRHIVAVRGKLDKLSIEISAVVYGGFLWDLRFWWFASRINIDKMLAANTPSSHHVSAMAQTIQTWNNLILPWCSADHQRKWRRSYVRVVDTLLATFRGSFLLLRTQPISAGVFKGNKHCHEPMNQFVRSVAASGRDRACTQGKGKMAGCVEKVQRPTEGNLSSTLSPMPGIQLVDVGALFASPPASNGSTVLSHFHNLSVDAIHLTSYEHYTGYILRVLQQWREQGGKATPAPFALTNITLAALADAEKVANAEVEAEAVAVRAKAKTLLAHHPRPHAQAIAPAAADGITKHASAVSKPLPKPVARMGV